MKKIFWSNKTTVFCDGSGQSGESNAEHPRVWLNMRDKQKIICPYCNQEYRLKTSQE